MNNYLIIFIDGLPYELLGELSSASRFPQRAALIPGFGYSINIHAEIFAGLPADQINFFNTWKFDPDNSPFRSLKGVKGFLEKTGGNRYSNRIFRELIRLIYRSNSLNIPYRSIDMFAPCGLTIYSKDFPRNRVPGAEITDWISEYDKDARIYSLAKEKIQGSSKRLFLYFREIDSISHKYGLSSEEYKCSLKQLDEWIGDLCDKFRSAVPDGSIVVFSDHGMSKVERTIGFELKDELPGVGEEDVIYFLDTTMLRIWRLNAALKSKVETLLGSKDYGRVLREDERVEFGVVNKKWGDIIFILDEGCVFDPSFLEKGHPLAMHGYYPKLPWQKGLFLYSGQREVTFRETITAKESYVALKEIVEGA